MHKLWCLCLLIATPASAFELTEHAAITRRAIAELSRCLAKPVPEKDADLLVRYNRREDINLARKWWRYSHYYNPEAPLKLRRVGADVRVATLAAALPQSPQKRLGSILHYLQDMASPPHVMPIKHGADDGFEGFGVDDLFDQPVLDSDCDALLQEPKPPLLDLLRETALATRASLSQAITVDIDGVSSELSWAAFFTAPLTAEYGAYGELQNHFGVEAFQVNLTRYMVPRSAYEAYKQQQLRLAVSVTMRAIYHYGLTP